MTMKTNLLTFAALAASLTALAASPVNGKYPWGFIPMWEGKRESILLNTDNIISIEPVFEPSDASKRTLRNKDAKYLKVTLGDGKVIQVYEDFDEFFSRIRNSQQ